VRQRDQLDFRASEIAIGGDEPEILDARLEREGGGIVDRIGRSEGLVHGAGGSRLAFEAHPTGKVPLRVHVDGENPLFAERERCR
jgi:hypothetical protein